MAYLLGFGNGILIICAIIAIALLLCLVNGKSKGLSAVVTYSVIASLFLVVLLIWPIKEPDEAPVENAIKTDIIMIPRTIFLIALPFFMIYLLNLYIRHELFHVVRAKSTDGRHGNTWLTETKIKRMR